MNTNNNLKMQNVNVDFGEAANSEFDNIESVETVYCDEAIDIIDVLDTLPRLVEQLQTAPSEDAANDCRAEVSVYSLSNARRIKLDNSIERRASKSRITDRRAAPRLQANGEPQEDRRSENKLLNIDSIRQK